MYIYITYIKLSSKKDCVKKMNLYVSVYIFMGAD
jgi:hypothetical protein